MIQVEAFPLVTLVLKYMAIFLSLSLSSLKSPLDDFEMLILLLIIYIIHEYRWFYLIKKQNISRFGMIVCLKEEQITIQICRSASYWYLKGGKGSQLMKFLSCWCRVQCWFYSLSLEVCWKVSDIPSATCKSFLRCHSGSCIFLLFILLLQEFSWHIYICVCVCVHHHISLERDLGLNHGIFRLI